MPLTRAPVVINKFSIIDRLAVPAGLFPRKSEGEFDWSLHSRLPNASPPRPALCPLYRLLRQAQTYLSCWAAGHPMFALRGRGRFIFASYLFAKEHFNLESRRPFSAPLSCATVQS